MSSIVFSRIATVFAAFGFMLVAGSARAQFAECALPAAVPEFVFETILEEASFDFGDVSEKACNGIVKEGIKTCKAQVKAAAKCFDRALDTNYKIALKQCQELEDSEARADCKAGFKAERDDGKGDVELSKNSGLGVCDDEFEDALLSECLGVVMKM
jgi:hypothetical protein